MINNQIDNKNNDSVLSNQPELKSLKKEDDSAVINLERIINFERRKKRKKLNVIFKKLITKKDFLHLHAISGASFLLLGTILVGCMVLNDINFLEFDEIRFLNSPIFIVAILIALVNALTAFPLMKLLTPYHNSEDKIAKKAMTQVLMSGGIYFNLIMIWEFVRFSNFFPIVLSFTDKPAIISLFFLICWNLYSSHCLLQRDLRGGFYIKLFMNLGSYSIILSFLPLLPLLISGQAWMERISSLYPLTFLMYTKVSFYLLVTSNILSFAVTLLSKKIINYKIISIFSLLPVLVVPFSILEQLIKYKEETTFNFFIGMF